MGIVLRFTPGQSPARRPNDRRGGELVMFTGVRYQRGEVTPPLKRTRRNKRKVAGE